MRITCMQKLLTHVPTLGKILKSLEHVYLEMLKMAKYWINHPVTLLSCYTYDKNTEFFVNYFTWSSGSNTYFLRNT